FGYKLSSVVLLKGKFGISMKISTNGYYFFSRFFGELLNSFLDGHIITDVYLVERESLWHQHCRWELSFQGSKLLLGFDPLNKSSYFYPIVGLGILNLWTGVGKYPIDHIF